jgi:predicted RNA-binding Zn-ribbon protein involved in translation (DUF1610 family)
VSDAAQTPHEAALDALGIDRERHQETACPKCGRKMVRRGQRRCSLTRMAEQRNESSAAQGRDKLLRNYVASRVGQIPVAVGELLDENERLSRLLLDVEGSLLAYWTDIPQSEIQRLLPLIREELGDYEPA